MMITGKHHEQYNSQPKARCTNPGSQVARATKFGTVATIIFDFHCFTVHFDSLSFIHTNSSTFSYNYVSVF